MDQYQKNVISYVEEKYNVFFTGQAGSGKTHTYEHLIPILNRKKGLRIVKTSLTGKAATLFGAVTLHSALGIGLGKGTVDQLIKKIRMNKHKNKLWKTLNILIIDEISMLSAELFEKLEEIGRRIRKNNLPFGGIQLVLSGDFHQLPPVNSQYVFESKCWHKCIDKIVELKGNHRQEGDEYRKLANEFRTKSFTESGLQKLEELNNKTLPIVHGIIPTKLFSRVRNVEFANNNELKSLKGEQFTYNSIDEFSNDYYKMKANEIFQVSEVLNLKVGAQVMLTKNYMDKGLTNGSRGVVTYLDEYTVKVKFLNSFSDMIIEKEKFEFKDDNNNILCTRIQYPIKLAWAMTIHKSQGQSCDYLEIDFDGCFENGQAYVAFSRGTCLENVSIKNFSTSKVKVSKDVLDFYKNIGNEENINFRKKRKIRINDFFNKKIKKQ